MNYRRLFAILSMFLFSMEIGFSADNVQDNPPPMTDDQLRATSEIVFLALQDAQRAGLVLAGCKIEVEVNSQTVHISVIPRQSEPTYGGGSIVYTASLSNPKALQKIRQQ